MNREHITMEVYKISDEMTDKNLEDFKKRALLKHLAYYPDDAIEDLDIRGIFTELHPSVGWAPQTLDDARLAYLNPLYQVVIRRKDQL